MGKLKSVFGNTIDKLQVFIDKSKDLYASLWYPQYFDVAPPQQSLTFISAIGRSRIEAAASIVDRDSATPLRTRQGLETYSGKIPAIRQMFALKEEDYRDFLALQNMPGIDDKTKMNQILDLIWGDVKRCGDSCHKRVDAMCLMAISTGKIKIDVTNNPDGLVHSDIDLLMPSANKKQAASTWATANTAKPITDIETVVSDAKGRGITFSEVLISYDLWLKFKAADQVQNTMLTYFYGPKAAGSSAWAVTTLDRINEYLSANKLPVIRIVDESIGIEKDGVITPTKFFDENNASFIPAGKLGSIKNALAMEKMQPVEHVTYADYNKVLISKWRQNEPWGEFTKGEWNAFPSFEAIDSTYLLTCVF